MKITYSILFALTLALAYLAGRGTIESTPELSRGQAISIARQFDKMQPSPGKTKALKILRKYRGITF